MISPKNLYLVFTQPANRGWIIKIRVWRYYKAKCKQEQKNVYEIFVLKKEKIQKEKKNLEITQWSIKFTYSEKATKFCEISNVNLTGTT